MCLFGGGQGEGIVRISQDRWDLLMSPHTNSQPWLFIRGSRNLRPWPSSTSCSHLACVSLARLLIFLQPNNKHISEIPNTSPTEPERLRRRGPVRMNEKGDGERQIHSGRIFHGNLQRFYRVMDYGGAPQCMGRCSSLKWWSGPCCFRLFHEPALVYGSVSGCLLTWVSASILQSEPLQQKTAPLGAGWPSTGMPMYRKGTWLLCMIPFITLPWWKAPSLVMTVLLFSEHCPLSLQDIVLLLSFSILTIQVRGASPPHLSPALPASSLAHDGPSPTCRRSELSETRMRSSHYSSA